MITVRDYQNDESYSEEKIAGKKYDTDILDDLVIRTSSSYNKSDKINLYCDCCRPAQNVGLQYQVLRNSHGRYYLRPYKNNSGISHSRNCPKHPENTDYRKTNPIIETDKSGKTIVHTKINFSAPAKQQKKADGPRVRYIAPGQEERQGILRSPYELFMAMNEKFFHDLMKNGRQEPNFDKTCFNPVRAEKFRKLLMQYDFGIEGYEGPLDIYELDEDNDGFAFLYEKVDRIYDLPVEWNNDKDYYVKVFFEKGSKIPEITIPVWFYKLLKERFSGGHNGREMEFCNEHYDLVLAGSYGLNNGKYELYKGAFLMVSKQYGLAADSIHEARYYDMAIKHINNYHNYRKVLFYKPSMFMPAGIYKGKMLPDGILTSKNDSKKQCIIEIWGRTDEKYLADKRKKEKWLKENEDEYDYIWWDVNNEDFDVAERRFEDILEKYALKKANDR